jgi:alkylation response protein AidB-like acyl-CoA dehydrogenase
VRTDPDVPKHKGLSMFIVDLKTPGVTIRPLYTSAGLRTNEVFYEDVRVPKENLLGEKNKGWVYAGSALGFERIMWTGDLQGRFDKIVSYVMDEIGIDTVREEQPWILDELADLDIRLHIARMVGYRAASMLDHGKTVTYESSLSKLYVTETRRRLFKVAMEIVGHYGEISEGSKGAVFDGIIQREYLDTCRWTIVAGTSEIQRLVLARALGMPRK